MKQVLKRRITCQRLKGLQYSSYNVPDLPSVRVSEDPLFPHTGVDFAGPLFNATFVYLHALQRERSNSNLHEILQLSPSCWHFADSKVVKGCLPL